MTRLLLLFSSLTLAVAFSAHTGTVEIGAAPPPIKVKEWIKGGPVRVEPGKIYVVEFWATWCQRCREAIPSVSDMHRKFKDRDVVFMALTDEAPSMIRLFLKKMGDPIDYAVGFDEGDRIFETYMNPFGLTGIPHAFVIDKSGRLVWHGHPLEGLEKVLDDLSANKFDLTAAIKRDQLRKLQQEYLATVNAASQRAVAEQKAEQLLSDAAKEPATLNEFAWKILTAPEVRHRDFPLALRVAKQAFDATHGKNPSVLDTYARALSENGRSAEAIEIQKTAMALATDEEQRIEFEANLKKYQRLARQKGP